MQPRHVRAPTHAWVRLCRLYHLPAARCDRRRWSGPLRSSPCRAPAFFMARTVPVLAPNPPPTSAFPPFLNE